MASDPTEEQRPHRVRIIFSKDRAARFLSHLDLLATLEYAVRRAGLPVALSAGFNPRPRLSLAAPLAVGYLGEREILDLVLRDPSPPEEVQHALQSVLPTGLTIQTVTAIPLSHTAAAHITGLTYRVVLPNSVLDLPDRVASLLALPSLPIDDTRDGKTRHRDLRPLLLALDAVDPATLRLTVAHHPDAGTVRPEQILAFLHVPTDGALITREAIHLAASE